MPAVMVSDKLLPVLEDFVPGADLEAKLENLTRESLEHQLRACKEDSMPHVSLDIPDDLLLTLHEQPGEFAQEVRLVAAIHYLREKRLSLGQGARLAGMNRLDFLDALAARGVPAFDLSAKDAATEIVAGQRTTI